jgi:hypothetical protein
LHPILKSQRKCGEQKGRGTAACSNMKVVVVVDIVVEYIVVEVVGVVGVESR